MVFLGLDAGGTRSRHAWRPPGAAPDGQGPGMQAAVLGVEAAARTLARHLLDLAGPQPLHVVVAMAGAGEPATARAIEEAVRREGFAAPLSLVGDTVAAAAGALAEQPGVVVYAGTGSFAVARTPEGALVRAGGRGYLLDDRGSGYDLVRRAAAAVVAAADGLGPRTGLTAELVAAFAAPCPERLGVVLQDASPGEVAARLPVVLATAAAGDQVAAELVAQAGRQLADLVRAAAGKAGLSLDGLYVAGGGGVLQPDSPVTASLTRALAAAGTAPLVLCPEDAAARGAARLAEAVHRGEQPLCAWVQRGAV